MTNEQIKLIKIAKDKVAELLAINFIKAFNNVPSFNPSKPEEYNK